MPRILNIKDIDGEAWCCIGKPGEFESGCTLATPSEWEKQYNDGYRDAYLEMGFEPPTR